MTMNIHLFILPRIDLQYVIFNLMIDIDMIIRNVTANAPSNRISKIITETLSRIRRPILR